METEKSVIALTRHIMTLIDDKRQAPAAVAGAHDPPDLLTRLVGRLLTPADRPAWLDEDWIRRTITGLAAFSSATVARSSIHVVDALLRHPRALRRARSIAHRLQAAEASAEGSAALRLRLLQMIYEALRFRPMLPVLVRSIPRATVIAKDSPRARAVPAGGSVIAAPLAAMYDPDVFERPWRFCSRRPLEDYVHFGHGPHDCFGRYIADTVMIELIGALMRLPDLRRAAAGGRIAYEGPAVASLTLTFAAREEPHEKRERATS
jgi:cytochrome P450